MSNGLNEATRLIKVMGEIVHAETKSGANIEVTYGEIFELSEGEASVYLVGSRELTETDGGVPSPSEGFRVPKWMFLNDGDWVRVSLDDRGP